MAGKAIVQGTKEGNEGGIQCTEGRLPDFIIVGAMKSGTSTLHHILAEHPGIYIASRERNFFNIDDFYQLPGLYP
ncbi:sulfotransferase, partial [bacterium]|nr:sulfotransferase [bacterium]